MLCVIFGMTVGLNCSKLKSCGQKTRVFYRGGIGKVDTVGKGGLWEGEGACGNVRVSNDGELGVHNYETTSMKVDECKYEFGGRGQGGSIILGCECGDGETCDHICGLPSFITGFTPRPEGVGVKLYHKPANMELQCGGGNPKVNKEPVPTTNMEEVVAMGVQSLDPHDESQAVNPANIEACTTMMMTMTMAIFRCRVKQDGGEGNSLQLARS